MDEYVGLPPTIPRASSATCANASRRSCRSRRSTTSRATPATPEPRRSATPRCSATHPLDLCCCGIGENGHLAFNDPPVADFDDPLDVKVVALDAASRRQQVGEGHFATIDDVPTHAITVTIPALLRARRVLAIVPEARKAAAGARRARTARSPPRARRRSCAGSRTRRCISTPSRLGLLDRVSSRTATTRATRRCLSFPSAARAARAGSRRSSSGCSSSGSRSRSRCAPSSALAPWDVFHQGVAEATGFSFGLVVVLVGLVVLLAWIPLRQRLGLGTVLNTLSVGFDREPRPLR